jgi:hydrogenase maturation protease
MDDPDVVVLGVGNTLMQDDGVGVRAVRLLSESWKLPPHVRLIEGGVAGFRLLPEISSADYLLIIDAVEGSGPPGSIHRLGPEDLSKREGPLFSAHEVGICELLSVARFLGKLPRVRIVGVKPLEAKVPGLDLTPILREALPRVIAAVVEDLRAAGIECTEKNQGLRSVISDKELV